MMATGRGGRSLMGPLLAVNFVVYLIILGLAGWSLDKYIDGEQNHPRKSPPLSHMSLLGVGFTYLWLSLCLYLQI